MEMNETSFRIRPYSKRELAELYFPETGNARSAVANPAPKPGVGPGTGRGKLQAA